MGEILFAAKKIIGHGKFGDWIKENVQFSAKSANNYMNVYKMSLGQRGLLNNFGKTALEEVCKPNFPENIRDICFNLASMDYQISLKEVNLIRDNIASGMIDLESCEAQGLFFQFQQLNVEKYNKKIIDDLLSLLKNYSDYLDDNILHVDVNQFLNCKYTKLDVLPDVVEIIKEFSYKLREVRGIIDCGLPFDREKFLNDTNYFRGNHKHFITNNPFVMTRSILNDLNGNIYIKDTKRADDGTLQKEYDRWQLEQLGPEDFTRSEDDSEVVEQWEIKRIEKIISELQPGDLLHQQLDDESLTKEYCMWLHDQLGPEDITNREDDTELAEECDSSVQWE